MIQHEFTAIRDEVRTGFEAVHQHFEKMDNRFDTLTDILKATREDLKEIKSDVTGVNLNYAELRARVNRLEKKAGLRE